MAIDLLRDMVLRWDAPDPKHIPLIKESGATAVLTPSREEGFGPRLRDAGLHYASATDFRFSSLVDLDQEKAGTQTVLAEGAWPGVTRDDDVVIAAATQKP